MADVQELLREAAGSERASFGVDEVWQRSRTIRRRKIISLATAASVAVVVVFWIAGARFDLFQADAPDPARPAPPPQTEPVDEEPVDEEPATDVFVAEARDGSWTMFAGVDQAQETLCLSLKGVVCSTTRPRPAFVLMQGFDELAQEGFLYGTVNQRVDVLELIPADAGDPVALRLRRFPRRLNVDHLRFFVHPLRGSGAATLLARGANGDVLQETGFTWGMTLGPEQASPLLELPRCADAAPRRAYDQGESREIVNTDVSEAHNRFPNLPLPADPPGWLSCANAGVHWTRSDQRDSVTLLIDAFDAEEMDSAERGFFFSVSRPVVMSSPPPPGEWRELPDRAGWFIDDYASEIAGTRIAWFRGDLMFELNGALTLEEALAVADSVD